MKIILINDNALQKICAIDCHQKEDKMSIEINLRPYKLAPLDYTVAVSRLQSFSAYSESRKTRPSYPPRPTGTITDTAPKVRCDPHPSNTKVKHNRSLVV